MFPIRDLNPTRIVPIVTLGLIVVNVLVFALWQPQGAESEQLEFLYENAAVACELTTGDALTATEIASGECRDAPGQAAFPGKNIWVAALVSMFLHGNLLHLLGNMWFLWIFGNNVEEAYGIVSYLAVYLLAGLVGTIGFIAFNGDATEPLVGASGAIAGVLGAYLVLYPNHQILTLVFLFFVPIPALLFLGIWFIGQFNIGEVGVAWEAHVAGFLFGVVVTAVMRDFFLERVRRLHATTAA
ncbi:MAG: rhomboid family intramembrane serine protease [Acidimicrobiia bacterium]|nr:rhomboid family intramembrane serine protease [Acidimicrobiia bacterium]MBT8214308.1 rhomboid family intramembrane serine protease [Acidimicrobiia bacterium]NNF68636.1 rhomboid family intramembrane serine protease [Acidimicrobiia bacterium]NNK91164.1 rhomboid family intramembrane serine protease [Acidimicrobiia bacterium]